MTKVRLPTGQIAEFPDDMPREQIQSHIDTYIGEQKNLAFERIKETHPGMPAFIAKALMPLAYKEAVNRANPKEEGGREAFNRSFMRSTLEDAENVAKLLHLPTVNAPWPSSVAESESDKQHPFAQLGGSLASFLMPASYGTKALRAIPAWERIAEKAAPSLLRRMGVRGAEDAAIGYATGDDENRLKNAAFGAAFGATGAAVPNVWSAGKNIANRFSSLKNIDKLRTEGLGAAESHAVQKNKLDALKELLSTGKLPTDVQELETSIPELKGQSQELEQGISQIPQENLEGRLPGATGENEVNVAREMHENAKKQEDINRRNLSMSLNSGSAHAVHVSNRLNSEIATKKRNIGAVYDDIRGRLKEQNVTISKSRGVNEIMKDIHKQIKQGGYKSEETNSLLNELKEAESDPKSVSADHLLAMYRSTKSLASKAFRNSRKEGIDALDREKWEDQYKTLTHKAEEMDRLLEEHMPEQDYADLQKANSRWATEIAPLYKNKSYWKIKERAPLSSNMISEFSGNDSGKEILRNLVKENPDISRNVLGQRYAHAPEKLHQYDELSQEYINALPDVQEGIENHYNTLVNKEYAKATLENSQERASRLKDEQERIEKSFDQSKEQQKERSKLVDEKKKVDAKLSDSQNYLKELKEISKKEKISLQKKMEIENKIKKTENDIKALKKYALTLGTTAIGSGAGYLGIREIFKK